MKKFFKNALKVSVASLVTSIILYVVIIGFFLLSVVTANIFGTVCQQRFKFGSPVILVKAIE
ncbi:hypothetical protein L2095_27100 [Bacillus zanthoxyli]|nr:hypothetical protein [Bacillus zanthoxyli]